MGIYVNSQKKYVVNGNKLDTSLSLGTGSNRVTVQEWDYCGGSSVKTIAINVVNSAGVKVSSPSNGSTVGSPAQFVASATAGGCSNGVASMGVYVDNNLKYVATGNTLNTPISLSPGSHRAVVQEWDNCGGAANAPIALNVTSNNGVFITKPSNNSTVDSTPEFVATASSSSCPRGVASMGIYIDGSKKYVSNGSSLDAEVSVSPGTHKATVQEWDYCGGSTKSTITINAQGEPGTVISNIQRLGNWDKWGELAPVYAICSQCSGVAWSMKQNISAPSLSGNATQFWLGGDTPYSDALFSNKVLGQGTTTGQPDTNRKIIPNIHNFIYETDVYVANWAVTQALEFDVNIYQDGVGMEWGMQCNHLHGGVWDVWDNVNAHWMHTSIPCVMQNGWNHVSFQVQRKSNNDLVYQTITLNGTTSTINQTYAPFKVSSGWYGVTVNYQMDGNYKQTDYSTYLDNFNLRYW